jgi:two-component system sensor histidine kinase RegB
MRVTWPINAMSRSIGNLLNNALQASPPELPVVVSGAAADGDRVVMTIADRGRGMTAEELRRAGEPFFTTKAPGAGTGLGLFVARSTVEQLGGSLTLSSSSGGGTTAALDLPRDVTKARP